MEKIDFHTHTTASDGIRTPENLIDFAIENGLIAMAITDHDTVDGLEPAVRHARERDFTFYPGIEFSIDYDAGSFHLIGFNIDYNHVELQQTVKQLAEFRATRAYRIVDDLKKHGIDLEIKEVEELAGGGSIGRPHVARVLVKYGYAENTRSVFKDYLVKGKPGFVKKERIAFDRAIELIKDAGGIAIIAHPISLEYADYDEFEKLLSGFIAGGVEGLEAYAGMHTREEARIFHEIALKHNLVVSGGSDYHGDKDESIGYYTDGEPIPLDVYHGMQKYLAQK